MALNPANALEFYEHVSPDRLSRLISDKPLEEFGNM